MKNKLYTVIITETNTYKHTVEGLSKKEISEAFERGDVHYTEGNIINSNSKLVEINKLIKQITFFKSIIKKVNL